MIPRMHAFRGGHLHSVIADVMKKERKPCVFVWFFGLFRSHADSRCRREQVPIELDWIFGACVPSTEDRPSSAAHHPLCVVPFFSLVLSGTCRSLLSQLALSRSVACEYDPGFILTRKEHEPKRKKKNEKKKKRSCDTAYCTVLRILYRRQSLTCSPAPKNCHVSICLQQITSSERGAAAGWLAGGKYHSTVLSTFYIQYLVHSSGSPAASKCGARTASGWSLANLANLANP